MKLYNPFKAHIVEFANGTFAIRRLGFMGFEYADKIDNYWWYQKSNLSKYSTFISLSDATDQMHKITMKVVKVHG